MKSGELPSLLLLPPPPRPAGPLELSAAYRPTLESVISRLKECKASDGSTLIIALPSPVLSGQFRRHKSLAWPEQQSILAGMYSLVSVVCAQLQVATEVDGGPGSVDARVVLIDHDATKRIAEDFKLAIEPNNTVIVDLATFVAAYHPWKQIFSASTEAGHEQLSTYLRMYEGMQVLNQDQLIKVDGGLTLNKESLDSIPTSLTTTPHSVVCLGGTFDHLHPGHKLLLTAAILLLKVPDEGSAEPCSFVVGITGDELLKNKKYAEFVQPWEDRAMSVIDFLSSMLELQKQGWKAGAAERKITKKDGEITALFRSDTISVTCVQIQDAFGPTITQQNMDALVVSGETRSGGAAVNAKRIELGWHPLQIFEVDVLSAEEITDEPTKTENFASKISSTSIRKMRADSHM
ncbi:pantetheine-phosphate adenylyltransferase-like protein [Apiospora arundinis]|uniref:Pantetheine-phosphate adenylyltransferase-like protein n=1 Tax=Apiospora arundinis TaxID=335852 RepID=A0ABR2HNV2_9PEZI